ncbi:MAG: crossover junction endodeoxyribonuclease RuvC [bacterium]
MKNEKSKIENSRRVLGIDPGTGKLGWAVVSKQLSGVSCQYLGQPLSLLDCGLIETPANTPLADRLELIFKDLTKIIKKYSPDVMAIEELFFVKNIKTGISVAHARGVAMLCGKQDGLEIFEYKPNEIKLGIAGYGHASKDQIIKMLKLHLPGCNIKQDDTADAVAIALYHLQVQK